MIQAGKGAETALEIIAMFSERFLEALAFNPGTPGFRSSWRETMSAAEEPNKPGRFTPSNEKG
jgi:hypothetical protein